MACLWGAKYHILPMATRMFTFILSPCALTQSCVRVGNIAFDSFVIPPNGTLKPPFFVVTALPVRHILLLHASSTSNPPRQQSHAFSSSVHRIHFVVMAAHGSLWCIGDVPYRLLAHPMGSKNAKAMPSAKPKPAAGPRPPADPDAAPLGAAAGALSNSPFTSRTIQRSCFQFS